MSDQGTVGRGRGRGVIEDNRSVTTTSSTSEHRSKNEGGESSDSNGNGNGKSRYNQQMLKTRPENVNVKQGTSGKVVKLSANYFRVGKKPSFSFSQYRVDFEPSVENKFFRKALVNKLSDYLQGHLFDGGNLLFTTHKLPDETKEFVVEDRQNQKYTVKLKSTGVTISETSSLALSIYNTILRRAMDGLKMELVGRNLYDAKSKVALDQFRLELWPGFITSIRQHETDILTCVEVSHKVMRQETIYDIMRSLQKESRDWQDGFVREVLGSVVLTAYNNKTYRVDDVKFDVNPTVTFEQKGRQVSFISYYEEKYGIRIRDQQQPMLVSNPKARDIRDGRNTPVLLVPELCRATGLTDRMRSNFTMMRAMAEHTQMDPERRKARIRSLTSRIYNTPDSASKLSQFDLEIDQDIVKFDGRALKQETMVFGAGATFTNDNRVDWTNAMKSNEMFHNVPLKRWVFIYPKRCAREAEEFWNAMHQVANGMRYDVADPKKQELEDDRLATYTRALEGVIAKDPKMIVIIVPNNAADRYSAIKKLTCVDKTIPTQVIVQKTLQPKKGGVMSIATKVMIQINCKIGGAPWMINFPMKGTMTIGFDVTHDTRDKSKSFGAFVATMDLKERVAFFSAATPHNNGEELSTNIVNLLVKALRQFKDTHGSLPERILFYRDGVGDGQIEYVFQQELKRMNDKLEEIYKRFADGREPKFVFIIVNKRLNTRIFLNQGGRCTNPESGTVVDNTITLPERYDFFLVSQSVRQGTVAPTSYNIIYDTSGLSADQLQMISYKLTHLYYNWSGTTRVPAVVQYAHKLALLVGQSLHQQPNSSWNNQLYFL